MDNLWLTLSEAAKILQVTARQLRRYRAKGLLQEKREGRRVMVLSRDVKDLRRFQNEPDSFILGNLETNVLLTRLRRLEREVELLKMMVDFDTDPVSLGLPDAAELHAFCVVACGKETHTLQDFEMWINIFAGLRIESLEKIAKMTSEIRPWEIFLDLADRLTTEVVNARNFEEDLALQMLHDRLLRARKALREEATLYESAHGRAKAPLTSSPDLASA